MSESGSFSDSSGRNFSQKRGGLAVHSSNDAMQSRAISAMGEEESALPTDVDIWDGQGMVRGGRGGRSTERTTFKTQKELEQ